MRRLMVCFGSGTWAWSVCGGGQANGAGEQEQCAAEKIDGGDAEAVGGQAAEGDGSEPSGLPEQVEAGEDAPAQVFGDFGLQQRVVGDHADGGADTVGGQRGGGDGQ